MSKKTIKPSRLLKEAHQMASGLYKVGAIDRVTMREFDANCLSKVKDFSANQIKKLRQREKVSQVVFANCLNTSPSTVRQWEQGVKHPRGISLMVLNLIAARGLDAIHY